MPIKLTADESRFQEVLLRLLKESTNVHTTRNDERSARVNDLLELFYYIVGEDDYNPLSRWFK